jgi:serine/threonine protein kinase
MANNPSSGPAPRPPADGTARFDTVPVPAPPASADETLAAPAPPLSAVPSAPPPPTVAPIPGRGQLKPGDRPVPEYELIQRLGVGGYGEVWKARGPGNIFCGLKFIRLGDEAGAVELRGLDLIKDIRHPHLIGVYGTWQRDNVLIIAMELGDGTLLQRFEACCREGQPGIPYPELIEYMRETAKGIDYLNSINIQHRDIKPQNILLVGGGVKVADFGVAKFLEKTMASNSGVMTPAFAAPEFLRGKTSSQSDQYALGVTYCVLRGGRLPFEGNPAQMLQGHLLNPPDLTMLPEAERPVLARALAKQPEERWPNCRAFVQALAAATASGRHAAPPAAPAPATPAPAASPPAPSRPWWLPVLLALLAAALLTPPALLIWRELQRGEATQKAPAGKAP